MNILIYGAAGFIGTNIALALLENLENKITLVDSDRKYFTCQKLITSKRIEIKENEFSLDSDFDSVLCGQEVVYHLVSSTVPGTSNRGVADELEANVVVTAKLLDSCVRCGVRRIIFLSSGGAVYGKESTCPLHENLPTYPISSYGVQKVTIEKLLYLYHYLYGLDYRVIRLSNPYGPYQRPNGILGAVTTFVYKALKKEEIKVYGDGSVIRDFIYVDDAVKGILRIAESGDGLYRTFNLGCGYGTSIQEVLNIIREILGIDVNVVYKDARKADVPVNFLDISRYECVFGKLDTVPLSLGIKRTAEFIKDNYLDKDEVGEGWH